MKTFIIDKTDAGQRLDKFMQRVMTEAPTSEIYKSLRKKKVRVNGKHKEGSYRLSDGDEICMYINDEFFGSANTSFPWQNSSSDVAIVYEDDNILIADKPSGMFSQDSNDDGDSLESRIRSYLYRKGEIDLNAVPLFIPSLCHRIDRNTSGLVIAAKNSAALRILNDKIKTREIRKLYLCETEGTPNPESGIIKGYLSRDKRSQKMIFSYSPNPDSKPCETLYRTIKSGKRALVEAELLSGKTHQIRASLSHIGCPIKGDVKYGATPDNKRTYQHLISYKIVFDFKNNSGILEYLNGKEIKLTNKTIQKEVE